MSWEVRIMKSKTSFFNRGVSKNLLQRCWPLWAGYLVLLLLLLPLMLQQIVNNTYEYTGALPMLDLTTAGMGEEMIILSFFAAILSVTVMFSYLYNSRSCGMMNTLPITRTTMFFTACLTGLVPLLLADLLAAALCLGFVASSLLSLRALLVLLAVMLLSKLAFFGFAVFCAMLTGSLIILPLVFAVLSFTAFVAEYATRYVMSKVIFGLSPDNVSLTWLSPPMQMLGSYYTAIEKNTLVIRGMGTLAIYGAVGLIFVLLAWRLYLRRQMETAGDTVAIPILKPVFKYCMAFGCGILFAAFCHSALLQDRETGRMAAVLTLLFVLIGSLIGYFAAEMLIKKTVRVFRGTWRGWLVFAAAALLVIGVCEFDLFGWERRLPDAERVRMVQLNDTSYEQPESIEKLIALQKSVVANKEKHETPDRLRIGSWTSGTVRIDYFLGNGRRISRQYEIVGDEADQADGNSDIAKLQEAFNLPEALRWRTISRVEVKEENVIYFQADFNFYDKERDSYDAVSQRFSEKEAVDFYENALLPDLAEGKVGRRFLWNGAGPKETNVNLYLEFMDQSTLEEDTAYYPSWYSITLFEDNEHCLAWLREHCDMEILVWENEDWILCSTYDWG